MHGLVVDDTSVRVARYHRETVKSFLDVLGATGLDNPRDLKPWYVMKRVAAGEVRSFHELYPATEPGALLEPVVTGTLAEAWSPARPDQF